MVASLRAVESEEARGWLAIARHIILFTLGVAVIIDAVLTTGTHLAELLVGLVLVGYTSFDQLVASIGNDAKRVRK